MRLDEEQRDGDISSDWTPLYHQNVAPDHKFQYGPASFPQYWKKRMYAKSMLRCIFIC